MARFLKVAGLLGIVVGFLLGLLPSPAAAMPLPKFCSGCDLSNQSLQNADFTTATYVGANFAGAKLRSASFARSQLVAANFAGADLENADFHGAECIACNFSGAKLDGANFDETRIVAANFAGFHATISDRSLRELLGGCISCNFQNSMLSKTDLSGLRLTSIDFGNADLSYAKLDGASLCSYSMKGSKSELSCDNLRGARLEGASFKNTVACSNALERTGCTVVDAATLRSRTGGTIDGVAPPATPSPSALPSP